MEVITKMRKFKIMYIKENLDNLEKKDLKKICEIVKLLQEHHDMVYVTSKGTYIDFDKLENRVIDHVYEYTFKRVDEITKISAVRQTNL